MEGTQNIPISDLKQEEDDDYEDVPSDDDDEEDDDDGEVKEEEHQKEDRSFDREKDEKIVSKMIENSTVKLSDGSQAPMFSRGPLYPKGKWPVNCHLCQMHGLLGSKMLKAHINRTKKHRKRLNKMPLDVAKYKEGFCQTYSKRTIFTNLIKIYPGEKIVKITPELENRILPVPEKVFLPTPPKHIYEQLYKAELFHVYNKKAPVVGLSYCFYIDTIKSIGYYCSLCKAYSIGSAYHHFLETDHCLKYSRKHFPLLILKISEHLSDVNDEKAKQKIICEVIHKVYRSIELKRGFRKVQIAQLEAFAVRCAKLCNKIVHYGDDHVLTTDEELKEIIEKARKMEPPEFVDNELNWDRYRKMIGAALDDLDVRYADYEKIPEKHPAYEHEWEKFWNRRVEEIEKNGLNPDEYNFKTEWIPHWKETMQNYYKTSISKSKLNIKKSLRLPLDKRSPSPIRKQQAACQQSSTANQQPISREKSPAKQQPISRKRPPAMQQPISRKRPPAMQQPISRNRSPSPAKRRGRITARSAAYRASRREQSPAITKPSEPPGVISVLRLLTAFEDKLGSLGPKALEYLTKSLLYEKENGNNANQLLLKQEYYIFFITAKEKLKSQLIAGLIEKSKYKAVTHVVEQMETLIELFDNFCKSNGKSGIAEPQIDSPQTSKQQPIRFSNDDQYEDRLQDNYNRNRQQGFDDHYKYEQYPKSGSQIDQGRRSEGYNNQYCGPQNQNDTATPDQYNDYASNSNQYGQNKGMNSYINQESSTYQDSRRNQDGVWPSETNMTFRNIENSPQGFNIGNFSNIGHQRNQASQNFGSDRDGSLSTSYGNDRGGNYNFNPNNNRDGNYNSNLSTQRNINFESNIGNREGNYNHSSTGLNENFNTLQGDIGYGQGNDIYNNSQKY